MSNERCMAKVIYGAKLFLFRHHFNFTPVEIENVEFFCIYDCVVYVKPRLLTCFPNEATLCDLNFIQNNNVFKEFSKVEC